MERIIKYNKDNQNLNRLHGVQEVASSNLAIPTIW
jgi:hypothetical protein